MIPVAEKFGASSVLLPIFGDGVPAGPAEVDKFAGTLREFAPAAERAGVDLCLEDMVTATVSGDVKADARKNLGFIRPTLA